MRCTYLIPCLFAVLATVAQAQDAGELTNESLIEALTHRDKSVRFSAMKTLQGRETAALPALAKTIAEGELRSAVVAAFVLTDIANEAGKESEPWPVLNSIMTDASAEDWRWSVAASLLMRTKADTQQEGVLASVVDALDSPSALKQYAALKLIYYKRRQGLGELADRAVEALVRMGDSYRPFTELEIAENTIATGLLARIVHIELPEDPSQPLAELSAFFETPDHLILSTLERVADPENATTKEQLISGYQFVAAHRSARAQLGAADRLAALGAPQSALAIARGVLRQRWRKPETRENALIVIGELGEAGRPAILEAAALLKDRHATLRMAAADSITKIAPGANAADLATTKTALQRAIELAQLIDDEDEVTALLKALQVVQAPAQQ